MESVDSSSESGQSRESALRTHAYNGDNEQLQRFRTSQAISSDDFYGNSQGSPPPNQGGGVDLPLTQMSP